jgi:Methyltransferase domain
MKKINEALNTLIFSLKSKENLSVLCNKIKVHYASKKELQNKNEYLTWLKNNCSDYVVLANDISPLLWKEAIRFSSELNERSDKILQALQVKLGGGGIYPFLYFITRLSNPNWIVETGVAAGYTSQTFLSAIKKNGKGFLYSSDFPYFRIAHPEKYIGILVEDDLKAYWDLHIKGDEINLPQILNKLNEIDIFHYDSDKSYKGRTFATRLIEDKMSKNGFIIYDDIQDNTYFRDYIKMKSPEEWYIFEFDGKYVGFIGNISKYKSL